MRRLRVCWLLAGLTVGACVDVPAHQPCPADDLDCDGWSTAPAGGATVDCDDRDPAINPGASDDPVTNTDEDCLPGPARPHLPSVVGDAAGWTSGDLSIAFNTATRMPSSLRIGGVEALAQQAIPCLITSEEGIGVALYPAFSAHLRSPAPSGALVVEDAGPALGSSVVTWTADIPAAGANENCSRSTSLTASIRFSVLPGGRLIRHDSITVSAPVLTCRGCASPTTAPYFTSYLALDAAFDQIRVDGGAEVPFTTAITSPVLIPPNSSHRVCLRRSNAHAQVAVTWQGVDGGIRLRSTTPLPGAALVFDWRRGLQVDAMEYRANTSIIVDDTTEPSCTPALLGGIAEVATPPEVDGLIYDPDRGVYAPPAAPAGQLAFQVQGPIAQGFTVRTAGLGERGVTVWRRPAGSFPSRLHRDEDYLVQQQAVGGTTMTVVYLPSALAGDGFVIAAPGFEPRS